MERHAGEATLPEYERLRDLAIDPTDVFWIWSHGYHRNFPDQMRQRSILPIQSP